MANFTTALSRGISRSVLQGVDNRGWFPLIREPYSGAWQNNDELSADTLLAYHAVYDCITLISTDIGKLRFKKVKTDSDGIEVEVKNDIAPLLKPNGFQNHIQFKEWWINTKLIHGNTYVLKGRDNRGNVVRLYILDSERTKPLVSTSGDVFYQIGQDNLSGVDETGITVPASEIIHDRMNCLFHPLVGISPLFASGLAASHGLKIQEDGSKFFANGASPGGVLTAPGAISDDTARRLKEHWDSNYIGRNSGKVAVVGDGLKFEGLRMKSSDAQLIEQLRWSAEAVCGTFHVPAYKVGVGPMPNNSNVEALEKAYYMQCLQTHIESMETCLDEGLGFEMGVIQLDLDGLFRMDAMTQISTLSAGVSGKLMTINNARRKLNLPKVDGGDDIYMQQQDYSLKAIYERDKTNPLAIPAEPVVPVAPTEPEDPEDDDEPSAEDQAKAFAAVFEKELTNV